MASKSKRSRASERARMKVKEAEAGAAKAQAEAAKAQAEADKTRAETERAIAESKVAKEATDRDPAERAFKLGVAAAGPIAGMVAGHRLAKGIEAKSVAAAKARKVATRELAATTRGKTAPDPRAIRATAGKLKVGKLGGPLGLARAGLLIAEGLILRHAIAPTLTSETSAEAARAAGTGFIFAAGTLVGERAIQNATASVLPKAADLLAVEAAKLGVKSPTPAKPRGAPAPGTIAELRARAREAGIVSASKMSKTALTEALGKVSKAPTPTGKLTPVGGMLGKAVKVLVPAVAGYAAYMSYSESAQAGESTPEALGKGAATAADVLAGGGVSAYDAAKKAGYSDAASLAAGVATTADAYLAFGQGARAVEAAGNDAAIYKARHPEFEGSTAEAAIGNVSDTLSVTGAAIAKDPLGWLTGKKPLEILTPAEAATASGMAPPVGSTPPPPPGAAAAASTPPAGKAYLSPGAAAKAAVPPAPLPAVTITVKRAVGPTDAGSKARMSFETADGRTVQATEAQAAAYRARRKNP